MFVQNELIRKRSKQCFLRSKRREKSFWRSKRMRRAAALAEMRMRAAESLEELPLWRKGEMAMRVFIVVAVVIKYRLPARGKNRGLHWLDLAMLEPLWPLEFLTN